jgi:tryptophan synthase beta chain
MITAPESAHCLKYAIDEALKCKKTGEKKVIAFNNSGHGLLDLQAYDSFLNGKLEDYEPTTIDIPTIAN